jgi:hypothetical protein
MRIMIIRAPCEEAVVRSPLGRLAARGHLRLTYLVLTEPSLAYKRLQ